VREFERKLRLISDLPAASPAVAPPPAQDGGAAAGLGGGAGDESPAAALLREPPAAGAALPAGALTLAALGNPTAPFFAIARERSPAAEVDPGERLERERWRRLQEAARELEQRLAARRAALAELEGQLVRKADRLAATPSIWPTHGWVTSHYGRRVSPFTGLVQEHPAIDIASEPGTPVISPARGRVVFVGDKGPLGLALIIDHGFGVRTTFGHTREIFVKVGQSVERGQRIAAVGNSGRSTGPHLHYGLEINGRSVDPADYILD
jgi:murein DD-endopeptidase MepM/ murein hydrolase activator NlpD